VEALRSEAVFVVISEPFELAQAKSDSPRRAVVDAVSSDDREVESALLRMDEPVEWHGTTFRYLVVNRRDGTSIAADLAGGGSIECSFIGQPDERAAGSNPCDTSWWRGGLAGRATLLPGRATAST
jgi:hypothetical protein